MKKLPQKIDLHMHTTASDGTDNPGELLEQVKAFGIGVFSVTDHDAVSSCAAVRNLLKEGDPCFINGIEFSCSDENGKYHILGFAYDINGPSILETVDHTHRLRMYKSQLRLEFLEREFGFSFPKEERDALMALNNPGKLHLGDLLVRCGYARDKGTAIRRYVNKAKIPGTMIRPEAAIRAIQESGGVPVLAHAYFGDGSQLLSDAELNRRIRVLTGFGLQGLECYYSRYTPDMQAKMLEFADRYDLYVSAGSDYHGKNKKVTPGEHHLERLEDADPRVLELLKVCLEKTYE